MHVLRYLTDPTCKGSAKDALTSEYRLLCSGTIYRDVVGDPFKSEVSRILLEEPFILFAVNRPYEDYPLELALELTVPFVHEQEPTTSLFTGRYFHPDDEVASDLASLLTLLCRRLITVGGKVSAKHAGHQHALFGDKPVPMPAANGFRKVYWPPHPVMVCYSLNNVQYADYNPQSKAIDPHRLTQLLIALPKMDFAENFVAACRLYASALEMIHSRQDIAYQLLISSVETMANSALEFKVDDEAKVEHKNAVYKLALKLGISEDSARKLAIEACKGEFWAKRRFKKFITDNADETLWTEPDELFHRTPSDILPKRESFEPALGEIYNARCGATHRGERFPITASYTGGPRMDSRAASQLYGTQAAFPPVIWFERVVNSALLGFWSRGTTRSAISNRQS